MYDTTCVFDITEPTLTLYKAKGLNSGKAVLIIPGGGYSLVALYHEGFDVAELLAENGITAAVLKYRLPNPRSSDRPHRVPLSDARRALKLLREKAADDAETGVLGFSAGSHLATVMSLWESGDEDENPDFSALIYGVTNLSEDNLKWLEERLYYRRMTDEEVAQNTLLNLISADTPPAFLVHAYDDKVCNIEESTRYAEQLSEHNIGVEIHLFPKGGHGFGTGRKEDGTDQWVPLFINWVKRQ
jgi:acetyl esterase/lipase